MPANCFLAKREHFRLAARRGRKIQGPRIKAYCLRKKRGNPRLGIIVAKKHIRRASARNRVRRILREHFRQNLQHELPPMDAVAAIAAPLAKNKSAKISDQEEKALLDEFIRILRWA